MPKTHLEINANDKSQDCLITYYMKPLKDNNGKIVWANKHESIAHSKGFVHSVELYVKDELKANKAIIINISAGAIKSLYDEIIKIESMKGKDFFD